MSEDRGVLREIDWRELCPWLNLISALGIALRVRMLGLASVAVLVTIFGWWGIGRLFSGSEDPGLQTWIDGYSSCPWSAGKVPAAQLPDTRLHSALQIDPSAPMFSPPRLGEFPSAPYRDAWWQLGAPFRQAFDLELTYVSLAFLVLCALWVVAVWSLFGGALTRMAAMQLGREEGIGLKQGLKFAGEKWLSYFCAPLMPMLGVLLITLPTALMGLLMRASFGVFLVGLIWPLLLLGGLLMAIFLLGLFFGWPLMWAAISTEGTDSFDALSRSYSYVYQRPLHYLFYAAIATLLSLLGGILAYYFAGAIIHLTYWAASWGAGEDRILLLAGGGELTGVGGWGQSLIGFWTGCVRLLSLGFVYSYFWTASTAIYLLLRQKVDGTETDEVFVEDLPEAHNLPPLEPGLGGVPSVAPEEPAPASPSPSETRPAEKTPEQNSGLPSDG
jgi:hypothetical protein